MDTNTYAANGNTEPNVLNTEGDILNTEPLSLNTGVAFCSKRTNWAIKGPREQSKLNKRSNLGAL